MINDALKLIQEVSSIKYPTPKFEKSKSGKSYVISFHNTHFPKGGVDKYAYIEFGMSLDQSKNAYNDALDIFNYLATHSKIVDNVVVKFTKNKKLVNTGTLESLSIDNNSAASAAYNYDNAKIFFDINKSKKISNIEIQTNS